VSRYRVTDPALSDLEEIWNYIARDNPSAADRLLDRIYAIFVKLADQPRMGRAREELAPGLRSFPVGVYLIFSSTGLSRTGSRSFGYSMVPKTLRRCSLLKKACRNTT
jgi:toxin ParE1/3/4